MDQYASITITFIVTEVEPLLISAKPSHRLKMEIFSYFWNHQVYECFLSKIKPST